METYFIHICFEMIEDKAIRERLKKLATDFVLPEEDVKELIKAGAEVLTNSPDYKKLIGDLK